MKKIILIITMLLGFSAEVSAQLYPGDMYVKAGVGSVETHSQEASLLAALTFGYTLVDNLAIEATYIDFGSVETGQSFTLSDAPPPPYEVEEVSVDATAFNVSMVAAVPLSDTFSLYGRYGILLWDAEEKMQTNYAGTTTESDDGSSKNYGVGFMIVLNDHFIVTFSRDQHKMIGYDFKNLQFGFQWRL